MLAQLRIQPIRMTAHPKASYTFRWNTLLFRIEWILHCARIRRAMGFAIVVCHHFNIHSPLNGCRRLSNIPSFGLGFLVAPNLNYIARIDASPFIAGCGRVHGTTIAAFACRTTMFVLGQTMFLGKSIEIYTIQCKFVVVVDACFIEIISMSRVCTSHLNRSRREYKPCTRDGLHTTGMSKFRIRVRS